MDDPLTDESGLPDAYERLSPPALAKPHLQGALKADAVIVGGGYTGLSAAIHLAEKGVRVAVLEGRQFGWGGSGRAFGQIVPYARRDGWAVLKQFGEDAGERIIEAV